MISTVMSNDVNGGVDDVSGDVDDVGGDVNDFGGEMDDDAEDHRWWIGYS